MGSIRKKGPGQFEARVKRSKPVAISMSKSFKTEKLAREWINEIEHKVDKGQPVARTAEAIKFSDACGEFLAEYRPSQDTPISQNDKQLVATVNHHLGAYTIPAITHERVQRFIDLMIKTPVPQQEKKKAHPYYNGDKVRTYSASTVRKHYFAIKKVLEWHSIRAGYPLAENLFRNHLIPKAWDGARQRRLDKDKGEFDLLMSAIKGGYEHKEVWPIIIHFAIVTAARAQEIILAKWSDINIPGTNWHIPAENTKTGKARNIALAPKAVELLEKMKAHRIDKEPRVFHQWQNSNTLGKGFRRLAVRAGMDDFRFHDLRHEAVCRLFEQTDLLDAEIMAITGHSSAKILLGYAHLRPSHLAKKMSRLE